MSYRKLLLLASLSEALVNKKIVNRVRRIGREMRLHAQIGEYDMNNIILDLGLEVNVLTK